MIGTPFFSFLGYRDPVYAAADISRMCTRGEVTNVQAREIIKHLHAKGLFNEPMTNSQRVLLATLTRTARARPQLAIDNTAPARPELRMDAPLAS
jgi:hypothetical protein